MRRILTAVCLLFLLAGLTFGQDAPKASDKPVAPKTALPAEATIPADAMRALEVQNQAARNAQLEAENLQLRIEKAQTELKKLQEAAQKATADAQAAFDAAANKAGIPKDKLAEYEITREPDGSLKFKKK